MEATNRIAVSASQTVGRSVSRAEVLARLRPMHHRLNTANLKRETVRRYRTNGTLA